MTYIEQYNQYVQEWIKENPAFSGPHYEDMLEFDQWVDKHMIEFAEWAIAKNMGVNKFTLYEGELAIFKKEKQL